MADLIDRLRDKNVDGRSRIPLHQFCAAMHEYANSKLTANQISIAFDLQGSELTQFNWLIGQIDAMGNTSGKVNYTISLESVLRLAEMREYGIYHTKDLLKARLGIT